MKKLLLFLFFPFAGLFSLIIFLQWQQPVQAENFSASFDGLPEAPKPFTQLEQNTWDIVIHSRNADTWQTLPLMQMQHGPGCEPPMDANGHLVTHGSDGSYENAVFLCRDHVMTAINGIGKNIHDGYAAIYLTPNVLADFSQGEAVIRFDLSTFRSSARDWVDIWLTPFEENLQLPFDTGEVDLQGVPKDAVHIKMISPNDTNDSGFQATVYRDFQADSSFQTFSDDFNWYTGLNDIMKVSPSKRTTFELHISKTHLKFGIPAGQVDVEGKPINNGQAFWWIDKDISPLSWDKSLVQFGHHSYTPDKDCAYSPDLICQPDTWHWDAFQIQPAQTFTMIKADRRTADVKNSVINFQQPARAAANLRFSGIGKIQVSYDHGQTWVGASPQPSSQNHSDHFTNYWLAIPANTQQVQFRFTDQGSGAMAKDFAIWALTAPVTHPITPSLSSTPSMIASPTMIPPTPTSTPLPTPTATPTPTVVPTQPSIPISPSVKPSQQQPTVTVAPSLNPNISISPTPSPTSPTPVVWWHWWQQQWRNWWQRWWR